MARRLSAPLPLAGLLARSCEPVKRTPFLVCNRKDESLTLVFLERDNVWKPFDGRLADNCRCLFSAGPAGKRFRCFANSQKNRIDCGHEFLSQAVSSFLIPQRAGAELGTGFRMKIDPHAVARVPSGSPPAPFPKQRSERAPPQLLANAAPTPRPTQRRPHPLALPNWRAPLRRLGRVRHEAGVILPQVVLQ